MRVIFLILKKYKGLSYILNSTSAYYLLFIEPYIIIRLII